jgi:LCP family protein required for cell wall assembly
MKKTILILILFTLLSLLFYVIFEFLNTSKKIFVFNSNLVEIFKIDDSKAILFLGKMGGSHYGAENTDAMLVIYIKNNKIFIIHIPRDLIVRINNDFYKINSLYSFKKLNELLYEVSNFTGLKVKKYVVVDSYIVKKIVDLLGGLEVELKYPVTDAVSGYTLYPGKHKLNGEWVDFVIRSRYYPDGDFTRMKNQFIIIKSLKENLQKTSIENLFRIFNFIVGAKSHFETNLDYKEMIELIRLVSKIKNEDIKEIWIGYDKNIWIDGTFNIKINSHYAPAYGLYPKNGVGEYSTIREKIKKEIAEEH